MRVNAEFVNRFVETVRELNTVVLRDDNTEAANIRLKTSLIPSSLRAN